MEDWKAHTARAAERFRDGSARLPEDPDSRQRQLTRMANAAYACGLAHLMLGEHEDAATWLDRAARTYRESYRDAPPGSWGRPIGAVKARLLAGDRPGAEADARWTLELGAAESDSPVGRYAACLALCTLARYGEARLLADDLRTHEGFPTEVADALAFISAGDRVGYAYAAESVLGSFETRDEYLEDLPVADTVLVLQELAAQRELAAELESALLPA
jgi:hypothetical protein